MKLEELQVYNLSMDVAERIWAVDSVAANLSEGFEDIFIKRTGSFVIIPEVHFLKQKPG